MIEFMEEPICRGQHRGSTRFTCINGSNYEARKGMAVPKIAFEKNVDLITEVMFQKLLQQAQDEADDAEARGVYIQQSSIDEMRALARMQAMTKSGPEYWDSYRAKISAEKKGD